MNDTYTPLSKYLNGHFLYGDDFSLDEIQLWYEDEKEGYADLIGQSGGYVYSYHELDKRYCYKYLAGIQGEMDALGLGSAYGQEFKPILKYLASITIIEPSSLFASNTTIDGIPVTYQEPKIDGSIDSENERFHIITCFSVLHHIPDVSQVLCELQRVLKPGGLIFIREPIVTMREPITYVWLTGKRPASV